MSSVENTGKRIKEQFRKFTGTEALEEFSLVGLFSDVFRHHEMAEMERMFAVGTPGNVPALEDVNTSWPRPWMFVRTLIGSGVVYGLFLLCWDVFENLNLLPGLILTGAMAIPLSTVLFFFEVNVRRNVSLYQVVRLLFLGGIVSLIFSLVLFALPFAALDWMGASVAGIIEEPGKLLALLVVAKSVQYRYKLNGLLFGACVGAGFAIFESMGYAFQILVSTEDIGEVTSNILLRGVLSPFGHIAWTAIAGVALWRVKGTSPFKFSMLWDKRFLGLFSVSVVMHMIWNLGFELPFYGKYAFIGFVSWTVVFSLVQEGIREIRTEKQELFLGVVREYFENDGVIDDDERRELEALAEKIGIEAATMERLIASVSRCGQKGSVPFGQKGTVPAVLDQEGTVPVDQRGG